MIRDAVGGGDFERWVVQGGAQPHHGASGVGLAFPPHCPGGGTDALSIRRLGKGVTMEDRMIPLDDRWEGRKEKGREGGGNEGKSSSRTLLNRATESA